jgi:hypothetical protein
MSLDDLRQQQWEERLDKQIKQQRAEWDSKLISDFVEVRAADARVAKAYAEQEAKQREWEWKHMSLDGRIAKAQESFVQAFAWIEANPYFGEFAEMTMPQLRATDFRDAKSMQSLCVALNLFLKDVNERFPLDVPEYRRGHSLLCEAIIDCNRLTSDLL